MVAALAIGLGPEGARSHGETDHQIAHLTRLLESDSRNPVLFWQRGELYRVRENWAAAVSDFEKAASLDPQEFSADFGRGLVLLDRGCPDAALRANAYRTGLDTEYQTAVFETYTEFLQNTVL